jgi:rhodanese-related sulfurtransferase
MGKRRSKVSVCLGLAAALSSASIFATTPDPDGDGNRYLYDRYYAAEISAADAYLEIMVPSERRYKRPVLIDVRSLEEYAAGHPEKSYNVPYPRICSLSVCDPEGGEALNDPPTSVVQDDQKLYDEVYDIVNGDTDRLVMTLCRTGARSVRAGNILADPASFGVIGEPFTNVRNIWEGFVGQPRYAYDGGNVLLDEDGNPFALDLNNNGSVDDDFADVFVERKDANPDKDGWRNFLNLPWTTQIIRKLAYQQDTRRYDRLFLTPVE